MKPFSRLMTKIARNPVLHLLSVATAVILWTGCVTQRMIVRRYTELEPGTLWKATVECHAGKSRQAVATAMRAAVVEHWARRSLPETAPQGAALKVVPPRIVLARLESGYRIEETNRYLMSMRPWNASGSEWDVRELWGWRKDYADRLRIGHRGDYDFTQSVLITILYRFKDRPDRLYPETRQHVIDHLIVDRGPTPRRHAPRSLGLVPETENHLLMTESARYLANQWLYAQQPDRSDAGNTTNALDTWLIDLLERIVGSGLYEFNSDPYHGYALQALLNLETYAACERIAGLSRTILDAELWRYAYGSLDYRRSVPFRRNLRNAGNSDLTRDRLGHFAIVWTAPEPAALSDDLRQAIKRSHFALDAAVAGYAPPTGLVKQIREKKRDDYFVRIGRGTVGSPEIHSGGPSFLLSAGGAAPPRTRDIAVRPIVLMFQDDSLNRDDLFRIPVGPRGIRRSNRTGIHHRFACGDAPVVVPSRYTPEIESGNWQIFRPMPDQRLRVAVYNEERLGIMAIFPDGDENGQSLLDALRAVNDVSDLHRRFVFPDTGRTLTYDIDAPRTHWVMRTLDQEPLTRNPAKWPRFEGSVLDRSVTR